MAATKQYSTLRLFVRCLTPSAVEGLACFCFGIIIVAMHAFLLTLDTGNSLPQFFDGQWTSAYARYVVNPLKQLFANQTFNNVLVIMLWGFIGLCVYFLIEHGVYLYKAWRKEQTEIQYTGQKTIQHPLRRTFVAVTVWRTSVTMLTIMLLVAAQPLIAKLLASPELLGAQSFAAGVRNLIFKVIGWTVLAHIIVVFLRLITLRTRLFGEVLY
jgi:hypothetical protein